MTTDNQKDLWRNRKEKKELGRRLQSENPGLEVVHPQAAGIDVGNGAHYVAVRPDRDREPVRRFECFTADLHRLADWLQGCGVKTVAMQSTGVYWIPLYEILEERGFPVYLVNARHTKNLPGRKRDVQESQWLVQWWPGVLQTSKVICSRPAEIRVSFLAVLCELGGFDGFHPTHPRPRANNAVDVAWTQPRLYWQPGPSRSSRVRRDQNRMQECGLRSRRRSSRRAVGGLLPTHRPRDRAAEVGIETSADHQPASGERMSGRERRSPRHGACEDTAGARRRRSDRL